MKKILLMLTIILSNICLSQTNGISYSKGLAKPFQTWNDIHTIRWNMNNIAQTLQIDTTKITFYYNSDNDWGFISYIGYTNGQIFERSGFADYDVRKYENLSEFHYYNTMDEDSSDRGYRFIPKHVAMDSIASIKSYIASKDPSITNELQTLSISGHSLTISSGNMVVIPTQTFVSNVYNAGMGLIISGSAPNQTMSVNSASIMTVPTANDSLSAVNSRINGKVNQSTTLNIVAGNNVSITPTGSQNLSSNRSWTVSVATPSLAVSGQSLSIVGSNTVVIPVNTASTTVLTQSTGISVSGSAPNYTVSNSAPDRTVSILGVGLNVTSAYPSFTVAIPTRTMSTPTRSLNTSYTISATSDYNVNYSVYAQVTSALAGTNTADIYLEISPNNSTWTTISRSGISIAGVLSTSGNTQTVGGFIPVGYYVRIRSAATGANSGAAVFTYQNGQENSY